MAEKEGLVAVQDVEYVRRMSENEFKVRGYEGKTIKSLARGPKVLRLLQYTFDQELASVDLDATQFFKTGWFQPGHKMKEVFGYNPMGDNDEERQKLEAFLLWVVSHYDKSTVKTTVEGEEGESPVPLRDEEGTIISEHLVTFGSLDAQEILGSYGKKTPRWSLLEWLKKEKAEHLLHDIAMGASSATKMVKEYMGPQEERDLSPMWIEIGIVMPNKEDPKEIHDCEVTLPEDDKLIVRVGLKQNDMGFFVIIPEVAGFCRCVSGVFNEIEQKSYYPYYPFPELDVKLYAHLLTCKMLELREKKQECIPVTEQWEEGIVTLEKLESLHTEMLGMTNERGPQTPEGNDGTVV